MILLLAYIYILQYCIDAIRFFILFSYYVISYSSVNGKTGLLNQHRKAAEITTPKDQYITGHDGTVVIQR